jgi:hypothetical protein
MSDNPPEPPAFSEEELPTRPDRTEHRANRLLRAWSRLSEKDQRRVEAWIDLMAYVDAPPEPMAPVKPLGAFPFPRRR